MANLIITDFVSIPYVASFLLMFAIVFGLLSYSQFLKFDKRINAIVAVAVAAFASTYEPFVTGLQTYMPLAAVALVVLFFFVFIKKVFQQDKDKTPTDFYPILVILAVLILILGAFGERFKAFLPADFDPNLVFWALGILIAVLIFWAAYKYKEPKAG